MKAVILAGGLGTRLFPITKGINKHLLPIYDKPLIYYSLANVMLAKIKEILIISTPEQIEKFKYLLGDGKKLGVKIYYKIQEKPQGIVQGIELSKNFVGRSHFLLSLGDNILFSEGLQHLFSKISASLNSSKKSVLLSYKVNNPEDYGVIKFNKLKPRIIIEKPKKHVSNTVVIGLYFYNNNIFKYINSIKKSKRGEKEITDLNNILLKNNKTSVIPLGRGVTWFDAGSFQLMNEASNFIKSIQNRLGSKIACIEEIAFNNKWISKNDLNTLIKQYPGSSYKKYLISLLK
jgi:glucose-1-phosphate thymidylyltransferase